MDLKTFIAETLTEIADGVAEAQKRCTALGARVNPKITGNWPASHSDIWAEDTSAPAQLVYFDVALSATEASGKKGGAGVAVAAVFSAGASAESQGERSATSRIKFYVPLVLPADRPE